MELPTPPALDGPSACWCRSARSNIALIKRGQFDFDVVTDDRLIAEFYRGMVDPRCAAGMAGRSTCRAVAP